MVAIPDSMKAIEIREPGGPEVLTPAERPVPKPGQGDVLIRVAYAGVNRPDVVQRKGQYPPPPGASDIPGLEVSGTIVALGSGTEAWRDGDLVCALLTGGGYAEYAVAPAAQCLPLPRVLGLKEAAALPETFFTVWSNVFDRCHLAAGENFLVHGGTSGIGTTAIQLAKAFGARVYATAGSDEKCRACERLGADRAINYKTEDFVAIAKEAPGGGVNVILDMVGGDYIQKNISALAVGGRLCFIAFLGGSKVEVNFMSVLLKRLTITGSTLRAQPVPFKAAIAKQIKDKVWPLIAQGRIKPVMHAEFPLTKAADAHRLMESSTHIGKIVLSVVP
ncbi:MAG: NAD(P)H-quinone oxidoreductase [Rhodospirillales bacterium]|nr:NAD(P)H-quinone oxidoreductase [Rhodospirillales bacterium]